jgi:hypothetical protein
MAGLLTPDYIRGPLVARSGVKPSPAGVGLQVTQRATPDKWVTVSAGTCFIAAASAVGGSYECINDSAFSVQLADAHATLPRKDLLIARVYDAVDDTGTDNKWAIEAVQGTPAASPARPGTPAGAIALAEVTVPAASSTIINANITDLRSAVVASGGILPAVNAADVPTAPYAGMGVYRRDTSRLQMHDGTGWREVYDSGMGFAFGTLATVFGDPGGTNGQNITTTNEAAASAKVATVSGLQFTIPPGVPATRRLYVLLNANVSRAGGSTYFSFWLDGVALASIRRVPLPAGPESHDFNTMRPFTVPAAGTHTLDLRMFNEESGDTTVFYSGSLTVLLL